MLKNQFADQVVRPKHIYQEAFTFEGFAKAYSCGGSKRIEAYLMHGKTKKRVWIKIRNYETRQEFGLAMSQGEAVRFATDIFRLFVGVNFMPMDMNMTNLILEMYFKRRRNRSGTIFDEAFVYRKILFDCLRDGKVYSAQVAKKYDLSLTHAGCVLREMSKVGVLKRSEKVGPIVYYSLAMNKDDVSDLLRFVVSLLNLRRKVVTEKTGQWAKVGPLPTNSEWFGRIEQKQLA